MHKWRSITKKQLLSILNMLMQLNQISCSRWKTTNGNRSSGSYKCSNKAVWKPGWGRSIRNVVGIISPLPHPSSNMVDWFSTWGGAAAPPAPFSVYGPGNENEVFVSFSRNPVQVFQNILNNKWINKNNTQVDRQRTCDSYLPNSLRPIAYSGFICFRPEIHFFL